MCQRSRFVFFFLDQLTSEHGIAIEFKQEIISWFKIKPEKTFVFILTAITPQRFTPFPTITPPVDKTKRFLT